ncbi:MFS transporter [Metabacillus herbersteinensis]|uniref:MFS transporter n=1 Tax=Metabacillus herbersteinensis TaxID=283816 RepID=A0ABV6GKD5_9BACI
MNSVSSTINSQTQLSSITRVLLIICCFNTLANSLSNIFVNVFLFRITEQFEVVALFNLVMYVAWLPSFIFAGWLSKKYSKRKTLIIGGVSQLLFYLAIFILGESSQNYVVLLGLLFGLGSGFYWLAINVLSVDYTSEANRDWFNGVNGVFNSVSQMIGPFLSGWMIFSFQGLTGYYFIFSLSLMIFFITILLSFLFPLDDSEKEFYWIEMINVHRSKSWRSLTYAFMANAFRGGVLSFAILVWVYMATENESSIGNFALMSTTLSLVVYYLIGKYGKPNQRLRYMLYGNILLSIALLGLVVDVSWELLLVYGVISGICIPLFELPFHTIALNNISNNDQNGKLRMELVVVREIALSIGRITSVFLLFTIYLSDEHQLVYLRIFLLLLIVIGLTPHYFLRNVRDEVLK